MTQTQIPQVIDCAINLISVNGRYRKDFGDIAALAANIESIGLLHPIVIDGTYRLICGERRIKAYQHLGRDTIPARFINLDSIISGEHAENELRKDFTPSERVEIGLALEQELGERRGRPSAEIPQIFAELNGKETRELAAEKSGFGNPETYRQAKKVVEDATPEVVEAMDSGAVSVNLAAQFVALPEDVKQEAIASIAENSDTAKEVMREAVKKAHVANNSGNNEWYTPEKYITLARSIMGSIDTDPATSEIANRTVQAETIYTAEDDGRTQTWRGRVWMNPPYAQPLMSDFAEAVARKYEDGEIEQACVLVNNATETQWFQRMLSVASAVCFPKSRIKFLDPQGNPGAPLQGQAIVYMGEKVHEFKEAFRSEGKVLTA